MWMLEYSDRSPKELRKGNLKPNSTSHHWTEHSLRFNGVDVRSLKITIVIRAAVSETEPKKVTKRIYFKLRQRDDKYDTTPPFPLSL